MDLTKQDFIYPGHVQPSAGEPSPEPRMTVGQICVTPLGTKFIYAYALTNINIGDRISISYSNLNGKYVWSATTVDNTVAYHATAIDNIPINYYGFFKLIFPNIQDSLIQGVVKSITYDDTKYSGDIIFKTIPAIEGSILKINVDSNTNAFTFSAYISVNSIYPSTTGNITITSAYLKKLIGINNRLLKKRIRIDGSELEPPAQDDVINNWIDYLENELDYINENVRDNYVNQIGLAAPIPYSISTNDYGKVNLDSADKSINITYPDNYSIDLAVKPNKYYSISAEIFNAWLVANPTDIGTRISIKSKYEKINPTANDILADNTISATSLEKGSYILLDGISPIPDCIGKITNVSWDTMPEGDIVNVIVNFTVVLLLNNIKTINQVAPTQNGDIGLASPDGSISISNATNHIQLSANFPVTSIFDKTGAIQLQAGGDLSIDGGMINEHPIILSVPKHTGSDLAISDSDTTTIKAYIDNKPTPTAGVTSIKNSSNTLTGDVYLSAGSNMSIARQDNALIFTSTATSSVNGMTNVTITAGDNVAVTPNTTSQTIAISSTDTVTTVNERSGEINLISGTGITVAPNPGTNNISFTNTGIISINGIYGSTSNTGSVSITAGNNVNISTNGSTIIINATNTDTVTRVNGYTGTVTITASNGININTSSTGEVHISGESGRWYIVEGEEDTSHNWVLNFPGQLYAGEDTVLQGRSSNTMTLKILKSGTTTDTVANLVKNGLLSSGDMLVIHSVFNSNTNNGTSFTAMIRSITTGSSYYTYSLVAISNSNYQ